MTDLNTFLLNYKIDKTDKIDKSEKPHITHTSMGPHAASYNIPVDKYGTLFDLICDSVKGGHACHIIERPQEFTNLKVDIDLKFDLDKSSRQYTLNHVCSIVEAYNKAIKIYIDVPDNSVKYRAYIFERAKPYKWQGNIKDGIHIMYPFLICSVKVQHIIREHVLKELAPFFNLEIKCKNVANDVIDKSIISSNGWLLYGCSKPSILTPPYVLTEIFDHEFNRLNIKSLTPRFLIELLSIQNHKEEDALSIREEFQHLLLEQEKNLPSLVGDRLDTIAFKFINTLSSKECENIKKLVEMLSPERADMYDTWMEVGLCLHNISPALINYWVDFSRRSPKSDTCQIFESSWSKMKLVNNGLGLGSLHLWARMDNPDEYRSFCQDNIQQDLLRSKTCTTQDVAQVIYVMYQYQYKCTSFKSKMWYEYQNHRWHKIGDGVSLLCKIGTSVLEEYNRLIKYYSTLAGSMDDVSREQYVQSSNDLQNVTYKLRDITFKEKLLKECALLFYDNDFVNRLDTNLDLVCFENGVYDMSTGFFRDGYPEDCLSKTTGIDYRTFATDNEYVLDIYSFMNQVFPELSVRNFVLTLLGTMMEGRNPQEKFYMWTGVGGNGKSKLLELFEMASGDYTSKVPVTLYTKSSGSPSAANPELARLKGVRCATTQETEEGDKFNISMLKNLSGNDKIMARFLNENPFEFKPQFKQIFCCNDKPLLPPDDTGVWRRMCVIEFVSRFVDDPDPLNPREFKRDYRLAEKFHLWKEAFMYIVLEYYRDWKQKSQGQALREPESIKHATAEYQQSNDALREFINECLVINPTASVKIDDMYSKFKSWWLTNLGSKPAPPKKSDMKISMEKKLGAKYVNGVGWAGFAIASDPSESTNNHCIIGEDVIV